MPRRKKGGKRKHQSVGIQHVVTKQQLKTNNQKHHQQQQQNHPKIKPNQDHQGSRHQLQNEQIQDPPDDTCISVLTVRDSGDLILTSHESEASTVGVVQIAGAKERKKLEMRYEEEIRLYEASLEILKTRKQEVIQQFESKRSQRDDLFQEQTVRTEQKKGLEIAQVKHLQLLHELRQSLSKSKERLKRLKAASEGILSETEIAKLLQETAVEKKQRKEAVPLNQQKQTIHQKPNEENHLDQQLNSEKQQQQQSAASHRIVTLRNVYTDKNHIGNFWFYHGNDKSNYNMFLPCIGFEWLLVKVMNMMARETLTLDSLHLCNNHRLESLEYTCLDLKLCVDWDALPRKGGDMDMADKSSILFDVTGETIEGRKGGNITEKPSLVVDSTGETTEEEGTVRPSISFRPDENKHADSEEQERNHECKRFSSSSGIDNHSDDIYANADEHECVMGVDSNSMHDLKLSNREVCSEQSTKLLDPMVSLCPYELTGVCADSYCPYQHLEIRRHGKILLKELLPLPTLKLPPEPGQPLLVTQKLQAIQKPDKDFITNPATHEIESDVVEFPKNLNLTPLSQENVPPVTDVPKETPAHTSKSSSPPISNSMGRNNVTEHIPEMSGLQQSDTYIEGIDEKQYLAHSTKRPRTSDFMDVVHTDKSPGKNLEIVTNNDFVPLGFQSLSDSSASSDESDQGGDLISAYLDDIRRSREIYVWWMTNDQSILLNQLSWPVSITDWLHKLGAFRILRGGKGKKVYLEDIGPAINGSIDVPKFLGRMVDCLRLAIHAGRFDISGALHYLATEVVSGLQMNKLSFQMFREIIRSIKRVDTYAFERPKCFRVTFDLQLLLAVLSYFVQQLHSKAFSSDQGFDEKVHAKFSKDLSRTIHALCPPANDGHIPMVTRSPEKIMHLIRQRLFQQSSSIPECPEEAATAHGSIELFNLLEDVQLSKSCGLSICKNLPLSVLTDEILHPTWSSVKSYLRLHSNANEKQPILLRACVFVAYILFGTLENVTNTVARGIKDTFVASSLIKIDNAIQKILSALREAVSENPFVELILSPMFASSISLSTFLRRYDKSQQRLQSFLWNENCARRRRDNHESRVFTLSLYSELLWSQLVHLRASLPFSARVAGGEDLSDDEPFQLSAGIAEEHRVVANRLIRYGVWLHHISLEGDWNLVNRLYLERKNKPKRGWGKAMRHTYFELLWNIFASDRQPPKVGSIKLLNLSLIPLVFPEKMGDISINRSAFPRSVLVAGSAITNLKLSCCHLTNLPISFGLYFPNVKEVNLSGNELRCLPDSLHLMKSLTHFNARHNQLSSLPSSVGKLKLLQIIDLSHNLLEKFPISLGQCEFLESIDLSSNPLPYDIDASPAMHLTKLRILRLKPSSLCERLEPCESIIHRKEEDSKTEMVECNATGIL